MKPKQHFYIPVLVSLLAGAALGAWVVILKLDFQSPQTGREKQARQITPSVTSTVEDRQTYINQKYEFSFEYPAGWQVNEKENLRAITVLYSPSIVAAIKACEDNYPKNESPFRCGQQYSAMSIMVFEDYVLNPSDSVFEANHPKAEEIVLGGNQWLRYEPMSDPISINYHIDFPDKNRGLVFITKGHIEGVENYEDALKNILSTFKFAPPITSSRLLLKLETYGGLCVYGGCWSQISIIDDGSFNYTADDKTEKKGELSKGEIDSLAMLISQADFNIIRSKKFTGTCPVAYDGTETTYTFYTDHGQEVVASCITAIDSSSSLFRTVEEVMQKIYAAN